MPKRKPPMEQSTEFSEPAGSIPEYDLTGAAPLVAEKVREILASQRFVEPLVPIVQKNGEVIIYNQPPSKRRPRRNS